MGIFTKVADMFGSSLVKEGLEVVKTYFPPSMSDKEKKEAEMGFMAFAHKKEMELKDRANEADAEFNQRIKDLEGTAKDLKTIPIVGHVVLFLRGLQRPLWGFFTLYADYQTFSGIWVLDKQQKAIILAINLLVLGFLFGERAVMNVAPFVKEFFGKR